MTGCLGAIKFVIPRLDESIGGVQLETGETGVVKLIDDDDEVGDE